MMAMARVKELARASNVNGSLVIPTQSHAYVATGDLPGAICIAGRGSEESRRVIVGFR
jgi:hypothetical protein